jgi:hypothetical protein
MICLEKQIPGYMASLDWDTIDRQKDHQIQMKVVSLQAATCSLSPILM